MNGQHPETRYFHIIITGKGAHAARPHEGIDAIVTGSHMVTALYALQGPAVRLTHFRAGNSWNVLPQTVELQGSLAAGYPQEERQIATLIAGIAAGFGVQADVNWQTLRDAAQSQRLPVGR